MSADEFGLSFPVALAQKILLNLSGRSTWKRVDEVNALGTLEVRQTLARETHQLFFRCAGSLFQHHDRVWHFSPTLIRRRDNCGFKHRGVFVEQAFDLDR